MRLSSAWFTTPAAAPIPGLSGAGSCKRESGALRRGPPSPPLTSKEPPRCFRRGSPSLPADPWSALAVKCTRNRVRQKMAQSSTCSFFWSLPKRYILALLSLVLFPSPWEREPTALGDTGHADDTGAQPCQPTVRSGARSSAPRGREPGKKQTDSDGGHRQQPYPTGPGGSAPASSRASPSLPTSDPDGNGTKLPEQGQEQRPYSSAVPPQRHRPGVNDTAFFPPGWKGNSSLERLGFI